MKPEMITKISSQMNIQPWQTEAVIKLLDEGCTVPFIARYRKEQHGGLNDEQIRLLTEKLRAQNALENRRMEISALLQKQGQWTEELQDKLDAAGTMSRLEDIYRPFRPKRRTKAMIARERGLEPLAQLILKQEMSCGQIEKEASAYVNEEAGIPGVEEAIQGATDIITEQVSDDADLRARIRSIYAQQGTVTTSAASEEDSVYRMYYDYSGPLGTLPPHRVLAIDRGEKEGYLKVKLQSDDALCLQAAYRSWLKPNGNTSSRYVQEACENAVRHMVCPSIENEMRSRCTERAQEAAIRVFAMNLKPLLMQRPLHGQVVMGLDPGIRHGCKVAVVDPTGRVLDTSVIYPLPHQSPDRAEMTLRQMILRHHVTVAAIGNGTAGRETEAFFAQVMQNMKKEAKLSYMVVSEAGASVYSASELAAKEFPQYDVNLRSAISIARRLQDPLAELVKIDPKAIGVGQYQHDLKESELDAALDTVVEDCVNAVGVNVNTASEPLLRHVAGISSAVAKNIVTYREENGPFATRNALKKVPKLGPKTFEQCAGFLRIPGAKDVIENTGVHPESYTVAKALLSMFHIHADQAGREHLDQAVQQYGVAKLAKELGTGEMTLQDIVKELCKPGRDPRDELPPPLLRKDILSIEDLKPGMELQGTVRNVTDFGAFVDIGVHQDGLVHISQFGKYVRHPSEAVRVGDVVKVWVLEADSGRKRISLTMDRSKLES